MQPSYTPSQKDQQARSIEPHDVAVSVPLHQRSYRRPDACVSFRRRRRRDDEWRRRVARARVLR